MLIPGSSSAAPSSQSSRVVVSPSPVTDFDAAARSYLEGVAVAPTKHGVVTDVTVLPVHMGQDSAAAPKIKTKTTAQPPVTKPIHETKFEIVTEPFVPTPEKASPPKIVKQPLKNRRRPRSPSDARQDRVDATPRSDRAAHPRSWCM